MSIKKILIAIITIVITVDAGGQIQADGQKMEISMDVYSIVDFSVFEMHKIPSVFQIAPSNDRVVAHVINVHEDIGVIPSIVWIGSPSLAIDIIGFTPRQEGFIQADHQSACTSRNSMKHNAFQCVIMKIIPDLIGMKDGRRCVAIRW